MSQKTVERIIGKLATDEGARQRFRAAPREALAELTGECNPLTPVELEALSSLEPSRLERFADTLDPRLQKVRIPANGANGSER